MCALDDDLRHRYQDWRQRHDQDYCYDEIFSWVEVHLSRGQLLALFDEACRRPSEDLS